MALVRRGKSVFFIVSVRRGDRVTSPYLGSGQTALTLAGQAERKREATQETARRFRRELALWSEFDEALRCLCDVNRAHARAAMKAAGFYQHKRQWRKRGGRMATTPAPITADDIPESIKQRVGDFLGRSKEPDLTARDCMEFFNSIEAELSLPAYCWVINRLARRLNDCDTLDPLDPRARAQQALLKWMDDNWGFFDNAPQPSFADRQILRRYLDVQRCELAGPDAPLLEQMLADQVVLCNAEAYGLLRGAIRFEKAWDFKEATHFDLRRDRATRRMHESIKLLHLIRQKAGPALQVNVQQNLTVASGDGTGTSGGRTAQVIDAEPRQGD